MKNVTLKNHYHFTLTALLGSLALACSGGGADGTQALVADGDETEEKSEEEFIEEAPEDTSPTAMGGSDGQPTEDPMEAEGPSIIGAFPADGDQGIFADAAIEIAFNAEMQTDSVEAAYSSETLPSDAVSFEWNQAKTVLRIVPNEDLSFGWGVDPEVVERISYDYAIDASAMSASGESLDAPLAVSFSTARGILATLEADSTLTGSVRQPNMSFSSIWAGDSKYNASDKDETNAHYIAVLSFPLDSLGDDVIAFYKATLRADQEVENGAPYVQLKSVLSKGEGLEIYDVEYNERTWASINDGWSSQLGLLSSTASANVNFGVLEEVHADYDAERATQFALRFTKDTDQDDAADNVVLTNPELELQYFVP